MKKYIGNIITVIVSVVLSGVVGVTAYQMTAGNIVYTPKNSNWKVSTVKEAIDDLKYKSIVEVATLTTRGASYTMKNDGYVLGTASGDGSKVAELHMADDYNNNSNLYILSTSLVENFKVSIYVKKGKTIVTRRDGGSYDLKVYEFE